MKQYQNFDFLKTVAILVENIQCYITQKICQNTIFAFLEIRKTARKNKFPFKANPQCFFHIGTASRKSQFSAKSLNYSKQANNQFRSHFGITKDAETFSQKIQKQSYQKTPILRFSPGYEPRHQHYKQIRHLSSQYLPTNTQKKARLPEKDDLIVIPRLQGLISSEQILGGNPLAIQSRYKMGSRFQDYDNSILEVDDEDTDQFEDLVLRRLDKIESKVNQMLRQKIEQRIIQNKARGQPIQYKSKYKLINIDTRHAASSDQLNLMGFEQYSPKKHRNSSGTIPIYTFQNLPFNDSSNKKISNKISQNASVKTLLTLGQVEPQGRPYYQKNFQREKQKGRDQEESQEVFHQSPSRNENQRLIHFREQAKLLNENQHAQSRFQSNSSKILIDQSKVNEYFDSSLKYIPMSKFSVRKLDNLTDKTERQTFFNTHNQTHQQTPKISYASKNQFMAQRNSNQQLFQKKSNWKSPRNNHKKLTTFQQQENYQSDEDARSKFKWPNTEGKAYTQQGNLMQSDDGFSISSLNNIYPQFRQPRQFARLHGAQKQKKNYTQKQQSSKKKYILVEVPNQQQNDEELQYQETQRQRKYHLNRPKISQSIYLQEEENRERERDCQDRKFPLKKIPSYPQQPQAFYRNNRKQEAKDIEYYSVLPEDSKTYKNTEYTQGYRLRQRQGPMSDYQLVYQIPRYQSPIKTQFQTVLMDQTTIQNRKISSGSANQFKSNYYVRKSEEVSHFSKQRPFASLVSKQANYAEKQIKKEQA